MPRSLPHSHFLLVLALALFASPAYAVVATSIEPDHERQASTCRYFAVSASYDGSQALAHDVRLVSEIFANDPIASTASADGWLAGRIGMVSVKDAGAEKLQLEACMTELIEVLAYYSISSCGFEVSDLRQAWSEEDQRAVDEVLERYGQYGLGGGEDVFDPFLLEIISK